MPLKLTKKATATVTKERETWLREWRDLTSR